MVVAEQVKGPVNDQVRGVIDQVLASQNGNPSRVYSTGVSAGGTFSYRMACDMPNKIAAIGSIARS